MVNYRVKTTHPPEFATCQGDVAMSGRRRNVKATIIKIQRNVHIHGYLIKQLSFLASVDIDI